MHLDPLDGRALRRICTPSPQCSHPAHATAYINNLIPKVSSCGHGPPLGTSKTFFDETLLKMGFQTYIFCSNVPSKCRKCHFRDPKFKQFPGEHATGPPYNCVVTMASPSLKSWLRYCLFKCFNVRNKNTKLWCSVLDY